MARVQSVSRSLACICCLILLGYGLYWTIRIGYADYLYRRSPEQLAHAIQLVPVRADFRTRWAEVRDSRGQDWREPLETAARLDALDAAVWMDMGLRAEMSGDLTRAERCLLHAASLSKQFDPRWTLANYFLRRGDDRFWHWAKEALLTSYGDRFPLFQLCWNYAGDPGIILQRAIPDQNRILDSYLGFLLVSNRLAAAVPVAGRLAHHAEPDNVPNLLLCASKLLDGGQVADALNIWNQLCERKRIPFPPLDPERGESLTNGGFRFEPLSEGFDWRLSSTPEITIDWAPDEAAPMQIWLSGKQPENCVILSQFLPLSPGRRYELRFEYQITGISRPDTGLQWKVMLPDGPLLPGSSPELSSADWKPERFQFSTPSSGQLARLVLLYRRVPGRARIQGTVSLRNLSLRFAQ